MYWGWLQEALRSLPGYQDDVLNILWNRKKVLKFDQSVVDAIDKWSSRLVCAVLINRVPLFVVMPDYQTHRSSLLFATALIRYCRDYQKGIYSTNNNSLRVLYFGSTVGIREQLRQVPVGNKGKTLADLFQQHYVNRQTVSDPVPKPFVKSRRFILPEVFTIYSPVDPVRIMDYYQPQWIAIECSNHENLTWLIPLVENAVQKNIPVIAWGQNPLSRCVDNFKRYGQVWIWPLHSTIIKPQERQKLKSVLQNQETTHLLPLLLSGQTIAKLESDFREVNRLLYQSIKRFTGQLAKDALRIHWNYLRCLESLSIPFDFYEGESEQFWGMKSFSRLQSECEHFRNACYTNYPDLAVVLEKVNALLNKSIERIKILGTPIWLALCSLLVKDPNPGEARLIIFNSRARKQLFLLALLARFNRTEEELMAVKTWVFSLDEFQQLMRQYKSENQIPEIYNSVEQEILAFHPLLVGLPSQLLMSKLLPLLKQKNLDILLYSYQTSALVDRSQCWNQHLGTDWPNFTEILTRLSGLQPPQEIPSISSRLELADIEKLDVECGTITREVGVKPLWEPDDPVSEVARLLQADENIVEDEFKIEDRSKSGRKTATDRGQESWCETAIEVDFDQGWHVCFALDDTINVIVTSSTGQRTEERYVRSLKLGDHVIAIPEQRQQNLYTLIISRIHGHPSLELHLALIDRWQQDFVVAYQRWRQHGVRNLDLLLDQMQQRGSTLRSSSTLRQWLWGNTLCPDTPEDLLRLAEVLDMGFVRSYYRRIYRAAQRLRGLHRGLSRRLNNWLEQQATGVVSKSGDDMIDSELGITFSDFRNSLLILRVEKVQSIRGLFLRDSLGKFERDIQL